MAFDSNLTSLTANSFSDVASADTWFADRFGYGDWALTTTTTTIKEQLLVAASQRINQELFIGKTTTDLRDLQFPKKNIYDRFDDLIADTVVPDTILAAVYEQAYSLLVTSIFNANELQDMEDLTSFSESDNGVSRSYTFKNIDTNKLSSKAKVYLTLLPGIWVKQFITNIVR